MNKSLEKKQEEEEKEDIIVHYENNASKLQLNEGIKEQNGSRIASTIKPNGD